MPGLRTPPVSDLNLFFASQIPAACRTHFRGVNGSGRNIAAIPYDVRMSIAALRQRHFSSQDDMRGLGGVSVIRVKSVRAILPDVSVEETFVMQLALE